MNLPFQLDKIIPLKVVLQQGPHPLILVFAKIITINFVILKSYKHIFENYNFLSTLFTKGHLFLWMI